MDWGGGAGPGIAATVADLGRIRADQALAQGKIWGTTLATLGQTIGTTIAQAPQRAALEQERQARALELQSVAQDNALKVQTAQRLEAGRQKLASLLPQYTDPTTGEVNDSAVAGQLADFPEMQAGYLKNIQTRQAIRETAQKASDLADAAQAKNFDTIATILHSSPDAATAQAGLQDVVHANPQNVVLRQMVAELAPNLQLWGTDYPTHAQSLWNVSPSGQAAQRERETAANKAYTIPADAVVSLPGATPGAPRTQLTGLPKVTPPTAAADDQKYEAIQQQITLGQPVTPADTAFVEAYEKRKLLGPEAAAAEAAKRQAAAQAQQTALQSRAQTFTETQAGRKEYTDKVATPYQTALSSAQTLRDVVAAAQSGNNIAGAMQNLETAMAAIRAQGLNRINTTELGVPASAGNLWQRMQGRVEALIAGKSQSIPPDLQQQMADFAGILEKAATQKYQRGRASLLKTYTGLDLPDESAPGSTGTGAGTDPLGIR